MRAVLLIAAASLCGCAPTTNWSGLTPPRQVLFDCAGLGEVVVAFPSDLALVGIRASSRQFRLQQLPSGSGYRYGVDGYEWRGKGREATWTEPGKAPVNCVETGPA